MKSIVLVRRAASRFTDLDREVLARFGPVRELAVRLRPGPLLETVRAVAAARLVVIWFAGPHAVLPLLIARLRGVPSILIVGGIDLAREPDIGYGMQQDPKRRWAVRLALRLATEIVTNSHYSAGELERHTGVPASRATVVHHGVPDPYGELPAGPREPLAVTVGVVERRNVARKGLGAFVAAAASRPDVQFVLVGRDIDGSGAALEAQATANVRFAGWMEQAELEALLARASVYVQASRHEGFGMAVAEAMLAGCVPVVTPAGALPEVVGDTGLVAADASPAALAAAIGEALEAGPERRQAARRRVLEHFPLSVREDGLGTIAQRLLFENERSRGNERGSA